MGCKRTVARSGPQ
jgi:myb proto-oncogene protein